MEAVTEVVRGIHHARKSLVAHIGIEFGEPRYGRTLVVYPLMMRATSTQNKVTIVAVDVRLLRDRVRVFLEDVVHAGFILAIQLNPPLAILRPRHRPVPCRVRVHVIVYRVLVDLECAVRYHSISHLLEERVVERQIAALSGLEVEVVVGVVERDVRVVRLRQWGMINHARIRYVHAV